VETSDVVILALVILIPAAVLWGVFITRSVRPRKPASMLGIPQAMRPGQPDEVLEGKRLQRIQVFGALSSFVLAGFVVAYWFPEADRQEKFQERFDEEAVHRGSLIYSAPPVLEEDADAVRFKELEEEIALGQGCINCHGSEGVGGLAQPRFTDPVTEEVVDYVAPPLNTVFTRWDDEVVEFTIQRGRPGTPMPAWGVEFGGSMTDQMVTDVMEYLKTLPGNQGEPSYAPTPGAEPLTVSEECKDPKPEDANFESCGEEIFMVRCAVCHGPQGQGKEDEPYRQGMALWKGDVRHLPEELHLTTVINGRRFQFMPTFAEAPAQGIPIPPYPLTDNQIRAVVAYERTL
jgi:mono/diheme cytochrome c family protein